MASILIVYFKDYTKGEETLLIVIEKLKQFDNLTAGRLYHSYGVHLAERSRFSEA
jgi:hypothetical protein